MSKQRNLHYYLDSIDNRIIYVLIAISLSIPIMFDITLSPAPMKTADRFFAEIEKLTPSPDSIVLIAADWGPNTKAENEPQTEVAVEHLMRKRIPFAFISNIPDSVPFLRDLPKQIAERLELENQNEHWSYGKDWVNLGYRPGASIMIQGLAKSEDFHEFLKTDASGTPLEDIPAMTNIKSIKNISLLMEFTGSVGLFNYWLQFFQSDQHTVPYLHGCTAVTIPEAYIYFVSKQIVGLFEGIAGAAWYEKLLSEKYPQRKSGKALKNMSALSFAHLVIIALIVLGNVGTIAQQWNRKKV